MTATATKRKRPNIRAFYLQPGPMLKLRQIAAANNLSLSQALTSMIEAEHARQFPNQAASRAAFL